MSLSEHSALSWSISEAAKEASRRSKLQKREKAANLEAMEMVKKKKEREKKKGKLVVVVVLFFFLVFVMWAVTFTLNLQGKKEEGNRGVKKGEGNDSLHLSRSHFVM